MNKLNLENYSVSKISIQEQINTIGGDPFLRDLGSFFGEIIGSIGEYLDETKPPGFIHSQYGI
jgi:hypothetical protein